MFAQKLKKARENTGFSQYDIERETGIKRSTLASYEVGRTQPDIETLGILAEFYGVSIDWLFGIGKSNGSNAYPTSKEIDNSLNQRL